MAIACVLLHGTISLEASSEEELRDNLFVVVNLLNEEEREGTESCGT